MTINEFFILVVTISLAVIASVTLPVLLQVRRTSRRMGKFIENLEDDLKRLSKELTNAASAVETLATTLNEKVEKTDKIIDTVGHSANTLRRSTDLLKDTVIPIVASAGGIRAGIKAFTYFLTKSYKT